MTDYLSRLLDTTDPESARALLLSSLAANIPIPRALSAALGIRQGGKAWTLAWRALGEAREMDAELRAACERVERRRDEQAEARLAGEANGGQDGRDLYEGGMRGDAATRGQDVVAVLGAGGGGVGRLAGDGAALSDGRSAESDGGLSDDRSEQGNDPQSMAGDAAGSTQAPARLGAVGTTDSGGPHRDLRPGRGGRAAGEEEAEGGGEESGRDVDRASDSVDRGSMGAVRGGSSGRASPNGAGAAMAERVALPSIPRLSLVEQMRAGGFVTEGREKPRIEAGEDFSNDFVRVIAEASDTYGPGRLGLLKWVDRRGQMMTPALHALDYEWIDAFGRYYDSGRLIMLDRKGLRAGGSSSACTALTRCTLFAPRKLDAGTIGVVPIMSASRDEADGRFVTIRSYLRACGLTPPKKKGADDEDPDEDGVRYEVPPGGIAGSFRSRRSTSGGGIIALQDRYGHRIQFRILPALVKHGIGYTGVTGLADESDLWPDDPDHHVNPAEKILDRISERFTTTYDERALTDPTIDPGAEMLIFSASYNSTSAHKRAVDEALKEGVEKRDGSPAALTHLTRLGERGAVKDEVSRRRLAYSIGSTDPRLLAPGDPLSPDLPAWVFNPAEASIEKCYTFSKGDISRMLAKYGGRAEENARTSAGSLAGVVFPVEPNAQPGHDTVAGVAPSAQGWGRVDVTFTGAAFVVLSDETGAPSALSSTPSRSVLACASTEAASTEAERLAWLSGHLAAYLPPVAHQAIYDGSVLRLSPLRTLYDRGRLRHAPGLDALETALRSHRDDSERNPRLEALLAAVTRLVACYPWAVGEDAGEPMRGPRASVGFVGRAERDEDDPMPRAR